VHQRQRRACGELEQQLERTVLKTLQTQWKADKEQARVIAAERWEQEKRWREEDRAAQLKARERNLVELTEHNATMRKAVAVSYLTLVCHEDTWTFVARVAFGQWQPNWVTSEGSGIMVDTPTHYQGDNFKVNPNLPRGRITKHTAGLQSVVLSGHNLVRILETLRTGCASEDLVHSARCATLYEKFQGFARMVDPSAAAGKTTGVKFRIDDSIGEQHLARA
jgi:hypothetical protein